MLIAEYSRLRIHSESTVDSVGGTGRDRPRSAPSFRAVVERQVGQELQRISDEFHFDYINRSNHGAGHRRNGYHGLQESQSFPISQRRGSAVWQQFIQLITTTMRNTTLEDLGDEVDGRMLDVHNNNRLHPLHAEVNGDCDLDYIDLDPRRIPRRQRSHTDGDIIPWSQLEGQFHRQNPLERTAMVRRQDSLDSQGYDIVADHS